MPDLNRAPRLRSSRSGDGAAGEGAGGERTEPRLGDLGAELAAELAAEEVRRAQAEAERQHREAEERAAAEAESWAATTSSISLPAAWRSGPPRTSTTPLSASPSGAGVGERPRKLPAIGPSLAAGMDADRSAANDATDHAVYRALEAARPHGLEVIRSRPWVGTRVETEAIVVGPSGVWIVDGLGTAAGPVEKGFLSGHAGSELLNVVGGRTSIISGLLFDSPYQRVPVRGALCFDSGVPEWFDAPFTLAGIAITTPRDLIDSLFMPANLDVETCTEVARHLVSRF